jgi:hypothetical protein
MLPFILAGIAIAVGGIGVGVGVEGIGLMNEANSIAEKAKERYESEQGINKKQWESTQRRAEAYGKLQIQVKKETMGRFIEILERLKKKGMYDRKFLAGLDGIITAQDIAVYREHKIEAEKFIQGFGGAAVAGVAAGQGAFALVGLLGTASTGAAINGLAGAAAWNATLAWFGGGALAAGGGGMALGAWVLGGIAAGPALFVTGLVLNGEGEKALTKAKEYEAKVNVAIMKMKEARDILKKIEHRIHEFDLIVNKLDARACLLISQLETQLNCNKQPNLNDIHRTQLLVKSLSEVLNTPIVEKDGKLNNETLKIKEKYSRFE